MKAFITGISGFVGQHLANYLCSKNIEVYGSYYLNKPSLEDAKLFRINTLEKQRLKKAIAGVKPDYVFHLAAITSVKQSWENPELTRKVNVIGTRNILDVVQLLRPSSKILVVSSSEVYGEPKKIPIDEHHPLSPQNPYAESKLESERLCHEYDLPYVIVRSFTHIGPGQSPVYFCSEFAKTVAEVEKGLREPVLSFGDAEIVRDITDVRDIVRAYLLCLETAKEREVYNICSGKGISIGEILKIIVSYSTERITLKQDESKLVAKSVRTMIGDPEKFCKVSKWKQKITIEKSLKDLINYWRGNV